MVSNFGGWREKDGGTCRPDIVATAQFCEIRLLEEASEEELSRGVSRKLDTIE